MSLVLVEITDGIDTLERWAQTRGAGDDTLLLHESPDGGPYSVYSLETGRSRYRIRGAGANPWRLTDASLLTLRGKAS